MDMASSSMAMGTAMQMPTTATGAAAMATSTGASMGGMDMGMGMGGANACKISMLWNWYTIDACFLSRSWHITSSGMFGGSCIGVILLVMVLEALRRAGREYDRFILRQHHRRATSSFTGSQSPGDSGSDNETGKNGVVVSAANHTQPPAARSGFRPNAGQQLIRALLHMLQFAVAYFIMLLAMYYNGYIIICIFIGAFVGAFVFSWQSIEIGSNNQEVTFCCG